MVVPNRVGQRAYSYRGPTHRNTLDADIRVAEDKAEYKTNVSTQKLCMAEDKAQFKTNVSKQKLCRDENQTHSLNL